MFLLRYHFISQSPQKPSIMSEVRGIPFSLQRYQTDEGQLCKQVEIEGF